MQRPSHTGRGHWLALLCALALAACGGGGGDGSTSPSPDPGTSAPPVTTPPPATGETPMTPAEAARLLDQGGWGASEAALAAATKIGPKQWLSVQFDTAASRFGNYSAEIHTAGLKDFCVERNIGSNCWRDYYSAEPLSREFYQQAVSGADQLRQRTAWALSQIWVVSGHEVEGTYGLRDYQQMLRDNAFGNLRDLLGKMALHPVMGAYLNMVNNEKDAPNENFARELLQLFTIGPCELTAGGDLAGGACRATYDNAGVREVAFALTGWTYPAGGTSAWGKWDWTNPSFLRGEMLAFAEQHDQTERKLPGGVTIPASRTPRQASDAVLDALFNHPNFAPFIGKQMIQRLVTSNPAPEYVERVSAAIASGSAHGFGSGRRGDMKAVLAAILLDPEARDASRAEAAAYGRLREPTQYTINLLRAANGSTDGAPFYWWIGAMLGQMVYTAPSVFNYYPADYPLPGSPGLAPEFGLANAATAMTRYNLSDGLFYWNEGTGIKADASIPNATGTRTNIAAFESSADDANALFERIDLLLTAGRSSASTRAAIVEAINAWDPVKNKDSYRRERVRTAFYLLLASPDYQVQR
ncbi:DUF1800 domain-containing protein [Niveibacterium sp. 24ML]|uniref:DUF1800 domain-containing protein n=1 Tax=Niveibacterium sp. 24ML TaxID=2985512 RepID=UPI002270E148|nr:DUF1800 family protein [Niveibacterium sp. 24ML]MCX9155994.1 DUF1800 domain-containing protein [Niveibacterium sp. 24ML]